MITDINSCKQTAHDEPRILQTSYKDRLAGKETSPELCKRSVRVDKETKDTCLLFYKHGIRCDK